eukprot:5313835-Pleurochrysis_carterae.AAC.1
MLCVHWETTIALEPPSATAKRRTPRAAKSSRSLRLVPLSEIQKALPLSKASLGCRHHSAHAPTPSCSSRKLRPKMVRQSARAVQGPSSSPPSLPLSSLNPCCGLQTPATCCSSDGGNSVPFSDDCSAGRSPARVF